MKRIPYQHRLWVSATTAARFALSRGFTLIELLLAITILAMVVGAIFSAFQVGISAWQGGERDIVFQQSMRAVTEMVFREISGTYSYEITPDTTDEHISFPAFFGSADSLMLVSSATLQNRIGGLSIIEIWVDNEQGLMIGEAPALFTSYKEMRDVNLRDDAQAQVLSPWVKKITFRYFKREEGDDDGVWQEQWDPRSSDGDELPVMVEVGLLFEDVRGQEIEQALLVPIMNQSF
jgi:prepilin-type N-terminal cleavage/methylation domain-containing protein